MAADIFRQRMHHDGRPVVEGARQQRRRRIVDDERDAPRAPDLGDLGDRKHLELRVRQRLGVIGAGAPVAGLGEILRPRRVDEPHLDPLLAERVLEQVPGAAIKVGRTDDIVPGMRQVLDRIGRGRLPR